MEYSSTPLFSQLKRTISQILHIFLRSYSSWLLIIHFSSPTSSQGYFSKIKITWKNVSQKTMVGQCVLTVTWNTKSKRVIWNSRSPEHCWYSSSTDGPKRRANSPRYIYGRLSPSKHCIISPWRERYPVPLEGFACSSSMCCWSWILSRTYSSELCELWVPRLLRSPRDSQGNVHFDFTHRKYCTLLYTKSATNWVTVYWCL